MTGGVSADAFLLDVTLASGARTRLVLRQHGDRHCGHDASLEYHLLKRLRSLGMLVPEPLGFAEGGDDHHPYVLLQHIEGSTEIPLGVVKTRIQKIASQLVAIHGVETREMPELPQRFDPVPELLDFLPGDPQWDQLRSTLSHLKSAPFDGEGVLLHGDYWPSNIIWQKDEIAGVIDWEDAAIGDPFYDVACGCLELRYMFGTWGSAAFGKAYAAYRPVDPFRLALWQAYVAAAGTQSMEAWGLEPERVDAMRKIVVQSIREAGNILLAKF